jgi:hypothetical protein
MARWDVGYNAPLCLALGQMPSLGGLITEIEEIFYD